MENRTSSRRLFLVAGTTAALSATLKSAAAASMAGGDAELIALGAEIERLNAIAEDIGEKHILIFEDQFQEILRKGDHVSKASLDAAFEFSRACGREAAIAEQLKVDDVAGGLFSRLMSIPAVTQRGRAAKVRALLVNVMRHGWRGDDAQLDWPEQQARALLAEFAGMSAEEIANV